LIELPLFVFGCLLTPLPLSYWQCEVVLLVKRFVGLSMDEVRYPVVQTMLLVNHLLHFGLGSIAVL
jgi:hypothetical protein